MTTLPIEATNLPELQFIIKVHSRCNLNCSYCYVYNKGDTSWKSRPSTMSSEVYHACLERIREHCKASGQEAVRVTFHGGEPTLIGKKLFAQWCEQAHQTLGDTCRLELSVQTNGTLLDEEWVSIFKHYGVSVGLSFDGPAEIHDHMRVDHAGRGSYKKVLRGLKLLHEGNVQFQVLCVIQFGADGLAINRHFTDLGVQRINYLLPDFTHDTIAPVRQEFGPTPCADYLLPILDDWWANGSLDMRIGLFWHMGRIILGGNSELDIFGNTCYRYVFAETDGSIEGLDVLRICNSELSQTNLHVFEDNFIKISEVSPLHRSVIFEGMPLPTQCHACPERLTCGGGYLPHRFSLARGFNNPTVWCADMLRLFGRMRELLQVTVQETAARRVILEEIHAYA